MPRPLRPVADGLLYHAINRGNNRARVFFAAADGARLGGGRFAVPRPRRTIRRAASARNQRLDGGGFGSIFGRRHSGGRAGKYGFAAMNKAVRRKLFLACVILLLDAVTWVGGWMDHARQFQESAE
jgi:hypothetical protein